MGMRNLFVLWHVLMVLLTTVVTVTLLMVVTRLLHATCDDSGTWGNRNSLAQSWGLLPNLELASIACCSFAGLDATTLAWGPTLGEKKEKGEEA